MLQDGLTDLPMDPPLQHPAMPVEIPIQGRCRQCHQSAGGQFPFDLQARDQAIGGTGTGQRDEGLGGAYGMTGITAGMQGEIFTHIADMHVIALVKGDAGSLMQTLQRQPITKILMVEGR